MLDTPAFDGGRRIELRPSVDILFGFALLIEIEPAFDDGSFIRGWPPGRAGRARWEAPDGARARSRTPRAARARLAVTGITLDTGALIALEKGKRRILSVVSVAGV